jgi:hypothetical protein
MVLLCGPNGAKSISKSNQSKSVRKGENSGLWGVCVYMATGKATAAFHKRGRNHGMGQHSNNVAGRHDQKTQTRLRTGAPQHKIITKQIRNPFGQLPRTAAVEAQAEQ